MINERGGDWELADGHTEFALANARYHRIHAQIPVPNRPYFWQKALADGGFCTTFISQRWGSTDKPALSQSGDMLANAISTHENLHDQLDSTTARIEGIRDAAETKAQMVGYGGADDVQSTYRAEVEKADELAGQLLESDDELANWSLHEASKGNVFEIPEVVRIVIDRSGPNHKRLIKAIPRSKEIKSRGGLRGIFGR